MSADPQPTFSVELGDSHAVGDVVEMRQQVLRDGRPTECQLVTRFRPDRFELGIRTRFTLLRRSYHAGDRRFVLFNLGDDPAQRQAIYEWLQRNAVARAPEGSTAP